MKKPIRVFVADDQEIIRRGVEAFLSKVEAIKIVGYAQDGKETWQAVRAFNPDILLLDLEMPIISGWELLKRFRFSHPELKIIVLSAHQDIEYAFFAIRLGIRGYLPKSSISELLEWAIVLVNRGYVAVANDLLVQTLKVT